MRLNPFPIIASKSTPATKRPSASEDAGPTDDDRRNYGELCPDSCIGLTVCYLACYNHTCQGGERVGDGERGDLDEPHPNQAKRFAQQIGLPKASLEFQM